MMHTWVPILGQTMDPNGNMPTGGGGGLIAGVFLLIELALIVLMIAGLWKMFVKAGKPGWAAIVPIYNIIILLEMAGKPIWWIILYLIPIVNIVIAVMVTVEIAKRFGKGVGFIIGMIFLPFIFYPILGFGDAQYQGEQRGFAPIMPA